MTCPEPRCGHPQTGSGHPRKGWVRVNVAGAPPARWYCSITCAARALGVRVDVDRDGVRTDVGSCALCAVRHDLAHRCRSCGHTPPRPNFNRVGHSHAEPIEQRRDRLDDLGVTTGEVRAWARRQGMDLPANGPLAPDVIDTYLEQHQPNHKEMTA